MKDIKPFKDKVLIRAYEWPEKSSGGILYPEITGHDYKRGGKDPWRGKVLAVGKGVDEVKAGEIIRYQPGNYYRECVEEGNTKNIFLSKVLIYAVEDKQENILRAMTSRLVIEPEEDPEKFGSIFLPQKRKEPLIFAKVIAVGPKVDDLKEGDRVVIENKKTWQYYGSNNKRYLMIDIVNILGRVEG